MCDGSRTYIAIDLKSFYASVECVERGLDPLKTRLVVADESRTEKTICLAVTPALKAYGIPGRARLFEVIQAVDRLNEERSRCRELSEAEATRTAGCDQNHQSRTGAGADKEEVDFIIARPRMELYMKYSTRIYNIYLDFVSSEDIHVYSVDEVFMDVTHYLSIYKVTPRELALRMIRRVLEQTGITATAGIGTNLYLCKVAMDIVAKHIPADEDGVRIAQLDEMSYRRLLWTHTPITDFWRVGKGIAGKLAAHGMYTMGDVARCSLGGRYELFNQKLLYRLFGVNAELLIDHAWGYEPCRISDIKSYRPESSSLSQGQVLSQPYSFDRAKLVVMEMTDQLSLELTEKGLVTDQIVLTVGYDKGNAVKLEENGDQLTNDHYGRRVPKHAHGTQNLGRFCQTAGVMLGAITRLFDRIVEPAYTVRRMVVAANHVIPLKDIPEDGPEYEQMELSFSSSPSDGESDRISSALPDVAGEEIEREMKLQKALIGIKKKYGKNAVLKGMNFEEGATARERNRQVGGHRA